MAAMTEDITLIAPDISCAHCVATVTSAVGALPGVQHVAANADTKKIDVTFDPRRVSRGEIEAALAEADYPVQK